MSLPTPEYYRKELEELNTGYNISLQEVLKIMPEYKLANAISKISKKSNLYLSYSKNENKLKRTEQNIFNLKNSIEKDSYAVEESIKRMNKIIKKEEEKHVKLKEHYNQLLSTDNAAKGMLFDTQLIYNQQYIGNLLLTAIILFYGKTIYSKYY
jgi:hypothetical protein